MEKRTDLHMNLLRKRKGTKVKTVKKFTEKLVKNAVPFRTERQPLAHGGVKRLNHNANRNVTLADDLAPSAVSKKVR